MDDFSDDGFDDLNDNLLQELEKNAMHSTQVQKQHQSPTAPLQAPPGRPPPSSYEFEDDDLDDAWVVDEVSKQPIFPTFAVKPPLPGLPSQHTRLTHGRLPTYQQPLASHAALQAPPSQLYSTYSAQPLAQPRPPPPPAELRPTLSRPIPHRLVQPSQAAPPVGAGDSNEIVAALKARVSALQSELISAKGEAAIMRSKYNKEQASHEANIARLKQQNAEQLAKQERAVEAAVAAERSAATELQFVHQDLNEEIIRTKARRKDGTTTPKKHRAWGIADGFDEVEILRSPSKGQAQRRRDPGPVAASVADRTPTKGKRKKLPLGSPVMALETRSEDVEMADATTTKAQSPEVSPTTPDDYLSFGFVKMVLDHSSGHGRLLTLDLFSRYFFPSNPDQSFAAIIFDKLPQLGKPGDSLGLLIDFSEMLIDMWSRCLREKYHQPLYDLVSLLSFTLQMNVTSVVPHIVTTLLPMIQTTCVLVAQPRFESADGNLSTHMDGAMHQLSLEIDVSQCLSLLYLAAVGCLGPPRDTDPPPPATIANSDYFSQIQFWRHIQLEVILVLLSPKHPERDFLAVLDLLCASVMPHSIGPIPNPDLNLIALRFSRPHDQTPEFAARCIIDRVSRFLVEPPKWATRILVKQCRVRLAVLGTLLAFAKSAFGAVQLAASPVLIPRLVTVLNWAINGLYDMEMPHLYSHKDSRPVRNAEMSVTERGNNVPAKDVDLDMIQDIVSAGSAGPGEQSPHEATCASPSQPKSAEACASPSQPKSAEACASVSQPKPAEACASHTQPKPAGACASSSQPKPAKWEQPRHGKKWDVDNDRERTTLLNRLINQVMPLLHHLITNPHTVKHADMPAKLANILGAQQSYVLSMARLTFAEESLVLEAGISLRSVELAHELLEMAVTPEEGELISEAFGA